MFPLQKDRYKTCLKKGSKRQAVSTKREAFEDKQVRSTSFPLLTLLDVILFHKKNSAGSGPRPF